MGRFKRTLLGYRRCPVDEALSARDRRIAAGETRIGELEEELARREERIGELDRELSCLSAMVIEREREIRDLREELRLANDRHSQSVRSLETVSARLEELHAQARGQATRIRMKALAEAVEVSRRVSDLASRLGIDPATLATGDDADGSAEIPRIGAATTGPAANGHVDRDPAEIFEGLVEVEIGPLGGFSQLVGFEAAAEGTDATSEITVRRFAEGRATLAMKLDEPVELLRELEERSPLDFKVRQLGARRVVLDVDDESDEAQAA